MSVDGVESSEKLNVALAKGITEVFFLQIMFIVLIMNFFFSEAILEILRAFDQDPKLKQLKENCSNDMLKYIQTFVPHSMDVQYKIVAKYGFSPDNEGKNLEIFLLKNHASLGYIITGCFNRLD